LFEALHELAKTATKDPTSAGATETTAQLTEQAADSTLFLRAGLVLSESAKYFSDLVPVLIARDRE
jgi:hypothetical protein